MILGRGRARQRAVTSALAVLAAVGLAAACGTSPDASTPPASITPARTGTTTGAPPTAGTQPKQLWVSSDAATASGPPRGGKAVRVSPDGKLVVLAGAGPTKAVDAGSGKQLWQASEADLPQGAESLAVDPSGSAVYVSGTVGAESPQAAFRTVGYGLTDGRRLWAATSKATGPGNALGSVVATSTLVIVNGIAARGMSGTSVIVLAYDARTGAMKWETRPDDATQGAQGWFPSGAHSMAVSADGKAVYVTTGSQVGEVAALTTAAYDTATGARKWSARHAPTDRGNALGSAVAVSPDGGTVVVTGMSERAATKSDVVTIGYDAVTGRQRWLSTYNGPASQNEGGGAVAFAPDGATVFVAGTSEGNPPDLTNAVVLAYDTASGKQRWAVRWDGTGTEATASDLAIAPDGTSVVVVGRAVPAPMKDRYATAALDPATGAILWTDTFGITSSGDDNVRCEATSVAISRDGVVYVTGSAGAGTATVAYGRPR